MAETRRILIFLVAVLFGGLALPDAGAKGPAGRVQRILSELRDPHSKYVLVAAHRGDWRNHPENSLPAIESCIEMGVDIVEIDIKRTSDGELVLCHDKTLNRTTSGKGKVSDHTLDEIRDLYLRRGHGVTSEVRMPTLREALRVCKDRIVCNIDQGWQYYGEVLALAKELGMADQVLIKGSRPASEVREVLARDSVRMMFMGIFSIRKDGSCPRVDEYMASGFIPPVWELVWRETPPDKMGALCDRVREQGGKVYVNTLWPSLNGHLDDDSALADPDRVYGQIVRLGATVIQTDRPAFLIEWLHRRHRHKALGKH